MYFIIVCFSRKDGDYFDAKKEKQPGDRVELSEMTKKVSLNEEERKSGQKQSVSLFRGFAIIDVSEARNSLV